MPKQHQILAIEKSVKGATEKALTAAHHKFQKSDILTGLSRVYTPKDEDGGALPSERKLVQVLVKNELTVVRRHLAALFDVTATKDWTNTKARAHVVVDDKVLLQDVPPTYLLFLEKQLINLATFIHKLPMLDPSEKWHFDPQRMCYATEEVAQIRTKKIPFNHVKFAGDAHHPPQVEVMNEDVRVGTWAVTKLCGALPMNDVAGMVERVQKLTYAVKQALAKANGHDAVDPNVSKAILDYVFTVQE